MVYTVRADEKRELSVLPESTDEEIIQNIYLLLISNAYNIPLARNMGRSLEQIGKPIQIAKLKEHQNILDLIEEYEPRAKIANIEFDVDNDSGRLIPILEVETNG